MRPIFAAQHTDAAESGKLETEFIAEWWAYPGPGGFKEEIPGHEGAMVDLAIRALSSLANPEGSTAVDLVKWMWTHRADRGPEDADGFRRLAARVFGALIQIGRVGRVGDGTFVLVEVEKKKKPGKPGRPSKKQKMEDEFEFEEELGVLPEPIEEFLESWVDEENRDHA
jgi:hypothetical protein